MHLFEPCIAIKVNVYTTLMKNDFGMYRNLGQISMGSAELTRLFNICPDNWEACRGERRNYVPSMEEFFEEAIAQADPTACIEDQYK